MCVKKNAQEHGINNEAGVVFRNKPQSIPPIPGKEFRFILRGMRNERGY